MRVGPELAVRGDGHASQKIYTTQGHSFQRRAAWWAAQGPAVAVLVLCALAASCPAARAQLAGSAHGTVAAVMSGDTVKLADGRVVRLIGLRAPYPPLTLPKGAAWAPMEQARGALIALTLGRRVRLAVTGRREDRYGRLLAHAYLSNGDWIQGRMLEIGLARVETFADNRAHAGRMLALEAKARDAKIGLWRLPDYRILTALEAGTAVGRFALVQGTVLSVAVRRRRTYLNFGKRWKTDFTVVIERRDLRRFRTGGVNIRRYANRAVRVRGWVEENNGPMIRITHPEQIEVLDEKRG